jgi:hypothetical protein
MHNLKKTLLSLVAPSLPLLLLLLPSNALAAETLQPWWHVVSVSQPTNLHGGLAGDEVQKLTVDATKGDYVVGNPADYQQQVIEVFFGTRTPAEVTAGTVLPFAATAAEVQAALERAFPERAVRVSALAGAAEEHTYEIVFPGQAVEPVLAEANGFLGAILGAKPLNLPGECEPGEEESCLGTASVIQVSEGKPDGTMVVLAENVGDADVNGAKDPVAITDVVPPGLKAVAISAQVPEGAAINKFIALPCTVSSLTCTFGETLPPYDQIEVRISVVVETERETGDDVASASGGGAPSATSTHRVLIGPTPAPFGVEDYEMANEEAGGGVDAQAGSHPFQQTSTIVLNTSSATSDSAESAALPKDLSIRWPAGMIGDPSAFEKCTLAEFGSRTCPATSVLGVATSRIDEPGNFGVANVVAPLVNLEPAPGQAARLAFLAAGTPVFIDATVRTGEDYGVTVHVENIAQAITFLSSDVTVWGVPGAASHDATRNEGCLLEARGKSRESIIREGLAPCNPLDENGPPAFLTLPTACTGPLDSTISGDTWVQPGKEQELGESMLPALDGCNRLPFTPSIAVAPDKTAANGAAASTPTGLTVDEHVPQQSTLDANGLAEAAVKDLSVTLPEGVQINPSAGDGLLACGEEQIGLTNAEATSCPEDAKVATVRVKVPVLEHELTGAAYIATQNQNPFGSLMAMYIYAEDPISGVRVKAAGDVEENPATGQLTAHFQADPALKGQGETSEFLPEAPFEDVVLEFFGGERAPLATPARCGAYTTTGTFTPWSADTSDEAALTVHSSSTFNIESGPHGGPCPGAALPFAPTLTGGTTNINAGAFGPLTTTIGREDGEQNLGSVALHMPAGVEGLLSSVKLCPEAQANEGTCGPESQIGETTVSAGVGSDPVAVKGGRVYITEKYNGAPFGLSIVNPVKAGPFDLEHDTSNPSTNDPACDCIVVRAKIEVNPSTGELTVTTDSSGPHAIPHIIDGIPVQIKKVNVIINREHFTFNPTNCSPLAMTGTIASDESASALLSVPFQVANCALLKFAPKLTVAAGGHASKANGESLRFKIEYPKGAMGNQSWMSEAKFDIPSQLPARQVALQQACRAATFERDRSACPAGAIIGHAIVHTQVLPVALEGPVYFVSYGGAKFPDAVLVLKGYGITIELRGETFINKEGVTSATFRNTPDVPFESLEVTIPTGPFSEFGVNLPAKDRYNVCGQKLVMPTLFKASNGLEIQQNTPLTITGCAKAGSTRAAKLAAALKACKKDRSHARRTKCVGAARKRYARAKTK